jgi:hypothetical protein
MAITTRKSAESNDHHTAADHVEINSEYDIQYQIESVGAGGRRPYAEATECK